MLSLVNTAQRVQLVCTADRAITLKDGVKRRPIRWLPVTSDDVVGVAPTALKATVRPLNSDEQFEATGGLATLRTERLCQAYVRAVRLGLVGAQGPGVDALKPDEVTAFLATLPIAYLEPLGEWILDESCGFRDPLGPTE